MRVKYVLILCAAVSIASPLIAEVNQAKIKEWKTITTKNGQTHSWTEIARITEEGFSYMTPTGGGSVKFADLPEELQREIGYESPAAASSSTIETPAPMPAGPAKPGSQFDDAIKQNMLEQQNLRSAIAQIRAELAKAKALQPNTSADLYQQKIARREAEIKIKQQEGKILQVKKAASIIGASDKVTGNSQVDAATRKVSDAMRTVATLNVRKEEAKLGILKADLLRTGGSGSYQTALSYIERDLPVKQAEVKAAQAELQAARTAAQIR